MAWHQLDNKPLAGSIMTKFHDAPIEGHNGWNFIQNPSTSIQINALENVSLILAIDVRGPLNQVDCLMMKKSRRRTKPNFTDK